MLGPVFCRHKKRVEQPARVSSLDHTQWSKASVFRSRTLDRTYLARYELACLSPYRSVCLCRCNAVTRGRVTPVKMKTKLCVTFANDFRFPIPFPNNSLKANIKENSPCNRNKNPVLSHQRFGLFSRIKQSAHLSQKIKRTTYHPNPRTVVLWPLVNSHSFSVPSEIGDFVNPWLCPGRKLYKFPPQWPPSSFWMS